MFSQWINKVKGLTFCESPACLRHTQHILIWPKWQINQTRQLTKGHQPEAYKITEWVQQSLPQHRAAMAFSQDNLPQSLSQQVQADSFMIKLQHNKTFTIPNILGFIKEKNSTLNKTVPCFSFVFQMEWCRGREILPNLKLWQDTSQVHSFFPHNLLTSSAV